ncbi:hypothetical protein HID58_013748, partial [Brassica napus]
FSKKMAKIASLLVAVIFYTMFFMKISSVSAGWLRAHATFYGGSDASGTMGGACGYGNLYTDGYKTNTAALSTALFNDGKSCGGCYQIVCDASKVPQWCLRGRSITITATNFCPPTLLRLVTMEDGATHQDLISTWLSLPFSPSLSTKLESSPSSTKDQECHKIVCLKGSSYCHRVGCRRSGGMRFTMNGRNYFELVLISNVGGAGEISKVWIKGSRSKKWETMSRNWGANWQSNTYLNGQSLSFKVQLSNGRIKAALNVVPSNWRFGQSFKSNIQF